MSASRFNDENTLEDIRGHILVAQFWPDAPEAPLIESRLDEIIGRIEEKLARNKNKIRHNWFSIALDFAQKARVSFLAGDVEGGKQLLEKCWEHLECGNKAHRRKTAFIVDADGVAHPATNSVHNHANPKL